MRVRVERTTTEHTDIEVAVDLAEFREWTSGPLTEKKVREFIQADRDWPQNIRALLPNATWQQDDHEIRLLAVESHDAQRLLDLLDLESRAERAGIGHQDQDAQCSRRDPGAPSDADARCPICRLANAV